MVTASKRLRLYIAEEQQILREAYQAFFVPLPDIDVVESSADVAVDELARAAAMLNPDVMLVGIKTLQSAVIEGLGVIRESNPNVALVLLSASYDVNGIKALRQFSRRGAGGCAFLLKHTIDTVEQLTQVIHSVAEGRIIVDPLVMEGLIAGSEPKAAFLKDLSPRELEVLGWMAKGYRNDTIAEVLCVNPKTVERHINNIYAKLGNGAESKHARVHAVILYMKAVGLLTNGGGLSQDE